MKSLSSIGLGLSVVFGCLILALLAEIYYLLWWKRRFTNKGIEDDYSNPTREFLYMFCLDKPSSSRHSQDVCSSTGRITDTLFHHEQHLQQLDMNIGKDSLLKPFGDDPTGTEFTRLQSLSSPPGFLFTIVEETKEDLLETEDGKSRGDKGAKASKGRSLGDLLRTAETPLTSPPFSTPPVTFFQGFNPVFESATDAEFNKMRASPPPKFKFLQDAEEKLCRRKLAEEEEEIKVQKKCGLAADHARNDSPSNSLEEDGSFITIIVDGNKMRELEQHHQLPQHHSSTSRVLPLAISPAASEPSIPEESHLSIKIHD